MRSMRSLLLSSLILFGVCAAQAAAPKSPSYSGFASDDEVSVEVVFSRQEIKVIRAYYRTHAEDAGPDERYDVKSARKGLPPGIARNLKRGKRLPPGIAKRALPADLEYRLPPVEEGYERIIIDGRILLIEIATQIVHDVLSEAILG
jgi:Ni/Co efflux regulator RcnB